MSEDPTHIPDAGPDTSGASTSRHGQLIVNTGDGKGKSTAAFGVMLRSLARGWNVAVVQFLKSGEWKVGEEKIGRELGVDWWSIGEGFTWDSDNLSEDEARAREAWQHAKETIGAGTHQMVILDEITYPMNWGWIDSADVLEALSTRPTTVNVVATGRDAPERLIDLADTVSEVRKVKHAFDAGTLARKGLDY
ncbi:MAG: cob(I)yrinic acid a,c-diamide adenosyltransferase [Acidimicrobiales bacterium]